MNQLKYIKLSVLAGALYTILMWTIPKLDNPKVIIGFLALLSLLTFLAVSTNILFHKYLLKGAPYLPSTKQAIKNIVEFANTTKNSNVADLGCGDGRVLIALGKTKATIHGYEINPILVLISKLNVLLNKTHKNTKVYMQNYWNKDLSNYNIIVVFGAAYIMEKLEKKLEKELKPKTKIITNRFTFPNLKYKERLGDIYLYEV